MSNVEFSDERSWDEKTLRSLHDSNSAMVRMGIKTGIIRNIENAQFFMIGLTCLFFLLSIFVVIRAL